MSSGKIIIISAPSGAGKSTIIRHLMECGLNLAFSVSATSRLPRGTETHGVEYYFMSAGEFRERIACGEFVEYEEVYPGKFYGTLKSEIERLTAAGKNVIMDIDVAGGLNIKKLYGDKALALFIQPPCIEDLKKRLEKRATDDPEVIRCRVQKAAHELTYAPRFDAVIVNDELGKACEEATVLIRNFLDKEI